MTPFFQNDRATLYHCDVRAGLAALPSNSVDCCVTSPPYWSLRAYGTEPQHWPDGWRGELGLEPRFDLFLAHLVSIFEEVRRVLKPTGTLWINHGDSYSCSPNGRSAAATKAAGNDDRTFRDKPNVGRRRPEVRGGGCASWSTRDVIKPATDQHLAAKQRIGQPHRVVFALQDAGWYWRDEIVWKKPGCMPSSVTDRTTCQHEFLFMLTKRDRYFYDQFAIREPAVYPAGTRAAKGSAERKEQANGRPPEYAVYDGYRNKRSVWTINTEPATVDHYAAYPRALVKPCIRAGSSEHGCCASCGKPYERIMRKSGGVLGKSYHDHSADLESGQKSGESWKSSKGYPGFEYTVESLGWRKPCRCDTEERSPAVILDPFAGTGTTLEVAIELDRRAIGIELHPKHVKTARKRILGARPVLPGLTESEEMNEAIQASLLERRTSL